MGKFFCSAGNCWCENMYGYNGKCNRTKDSNARCRGVYKDNGIGYGRGYFFISKGYCPFVDKEHKVLSEKAFNEGYRLI